MAKVTFAENTVEAVVILVNDKEFARAVPEAEGETLAQILFDINEQLVGEGPDGEPVLKHTFLVTGPDGAQVRTRNGETKVAPGSIVSQDRTHTNG